MKTWPDLESFITSDSERRAGIALTGLATNETGIELRAFITEEDREKPFHRLKKHGSTESERCVAIALMKLDFLVLFDQAKSTKLK